MHRRVGKIVVVTLVAAASMLLAAGVAYAEVGIIDFESVPHDDVNDYGTENLGFPGTDIGGMGAVYPNLEISSVNGPILVKEGHFPSAYRGVTDSGNIQNACLGGHGFADRSSAGTLNQGADSDHSGYEFIFKPGTSVYSFSIDMLDYGDFFPYLPTYDGVTLFTHTVEMIAYDAENNVVDQDTLQFQTQGASDVNRTSPTYGTMFRDAGDACQAQPGEPGNYTFTVSDPQGQISRVTLAMVGDVSNDPGAAFDNIVLDYTEEGQCPIDALDFEGFEAGTVITNQISGMTVSTNTPYGAMIFDSANPTGGDTDLGTPNEAFGGPGVGGGGDGYPTANDTPLGNVLIISEDGDTSDPDDNDGGGTITFTFDSPRPVYGLEILDIDGGRNPESGSATAYDAGDGVIASVDFAALGNNSYQMVILDAQDVSKLEVTFSSSGALASVIFCPPEVQCDPSLVQVDSFDVNQGGQATATFTVDGQVGGVIPLMLISYEDDDGLWTDGETQNVFDVEQDLFGAGQHTMAVDMPACFYQVDLVCGHDIITTFDSSQGQTYSSQGRLIDYRNGGDDAACQPPSYSSMHWCIDVVKTEKAPGEVYDFAVANCGDNELYNVSVSSSEQGEVCSFSSLPVGGDTEVCADVSGSLGTISVSFDSVDSSS